MTTEVRVPSLGESVTEATVATWFKKPGDSVAEDEMLCELETDKVTVEVPAPAAGVLADIVAEEGQTVGVDALLANIAEAGEAGSVTPEPRPSAAAGSGKPPSEGKAPAAGGATVDVMVPALGESVSEATVSTWFKTVGDAVEADEMLCELETDKVSVEVPAPAAGMLSAILAEEGATVEAGAQLATIASGEDAAAGPTETTETTEAAPAEAPAGSAGRGDVEDAPAAKKAMAEAGLSRDQVAGSGRDGRVMKEDVARAATSGTTSGAAAAPAPAPAAEPAQTPRAPVPAEDAAREERVKMTRLRQTIARRLKDAQNTAAMLTTYNEVDMKAVMDLRSDYKDLFEKKHGVRLGFMSFFARACAHALKEVPEVNAEIDGTDIVYKNFVHMGVATGTPQGLVVPVIRDAHAKSFAELEKEMAEKARRARDGKLSMAEMQGGTFTISNG
ncbi:2-oxoglutarate dehydrogenase complex dihydrolipoyllysine-residue succinyltransferase, partial [Rhodosalinus sp.]|uniref:2-oxoglutarate dehydrogenase complex dihydrolipoyllysine-residue succinyltransferase n=1 Tax=Rhodosalinus sp. TaxID=2047741 RepID=UPI00356A89FA